VRIRQSFCYGLYHDPQQVSLDELFAFAARTGFAATEFWGRGPESDEVVAKAQAAGLAVASFVGASSLEHGLNDPANHDRIEQELCANIDWAAERGIPGLICFSGNRREGQDDADAIEATARGLLRVEPYARRKGVNLNLELLNSKVDHLGYQCDRSDWGLRVVRRVGSPRVKLLLDLYHMQIMEGDIIRTVQANIAWVGHFHTAGNPGRGDLDDCQEMNYAGICRAIAAAGYELYVGHEFWPKGDKLEALRAAFAVCDQGA